AARGNRDEADRIRAELAAIERELRTLSGLLIDPDVLAQPLAKRTVLRKAAEAEGRRDALQGTLGQLLDKANEDVDRLATIIREKCEQAKACWESIATPAQLNQLIGEFVGPSMVTVDGRLLPVAKKEEATGLAVASVPGVIAGGGFEPPTSGL